MFKFYGVISVTHRKVYDHWRVNSLQVTVLTL